jgi:hypothetical protein
MGRQRKPDPAAEQLRRRGQYANAEDRQAAVKTSKYASAMVGRLHDRVKTVSAARPGLDVLLFTRSIVDKTPKGTFGARAHAALKLAAVLRLHALRCP